MQNKIVNNQFHRDNDRYKTQMHLSDYEICDYPNEISTESFKHYINQYYKMRYLKKKNFLLYK